MHIDINSLSRETGVNVRTIRYYVSQGLLSPPSGRGPAAAYGEGHRERLCLIRRLQDAHLPLREIKAKLASLDDAGVAAALAQATEGTPGSAYDCVRQVLGKSAPAERKSGRAPAPQAPAASSVATGSRTSDRTPERSTWERIAVHPAIELHVRRPLSRADQRRLEALLEQAQRLFADDR
jgi:DNA-binding transcriptional MerR regulator